MPEIFAKRDFRYRDDRTGQSVEVRRGERLNTDHFAANRGDVEKMVRTGYVEHAGVVIAPAAPKRSKKKGA